MEEKKLLENEAIENANGGAAGLNSRMDEISFTKPKRVLSGDASLASSAGLSALAYYSENPVGFFEPDAVAAADLASPKKPVK